jgi:hypothetical protein
MPQAESFAANPREGALRRSPAAARRVDSRQSSPEMLSLRRERTSRHAWMPQCVFYRVSSMCETEKVVEVELHVKLLMDSTCEGKRAEQAAGICTWAARAGPPEAPHFTRARRLASACHRHVPHIGENGPFMMPSCLLCTNRTAAFVVAEPCHWAGDLPEDDIYATTPRRIYGTGTCSGTRHFRILFQLWKHQALSDRRSHALW